MRAYQIELINRDRFTIEVLENQTILEALEQVGMRLPVGCRYGACITCAAKLIQGEVDQAQQRCLNRPKWLQVLCCCASLILVQTANLK